MTFRGTFPHTLDAKHRLTIPAKFRAALAEGVVLAPYAELPGAPRTLAIWTPEGFDEFMADDVGMVKRIYEVAGQPMTDEAQAAMTAFMDEHPRGRHGGVIYDLAQFGLEREQLRESMDFYTERFGVSEED